MKIESYIPGSFCWSELGTTDTSAAKKFYGEMFGWSAADQPMPQGVYTLWQLEGNDVGGMYTAPPGCPPNWAPHFSVASADEASAKATALGGKVCMGPFDAHEAGRLAVIQDPQGAMFNIWQAKKNIGATHGGPIGNFCWPELHTTDAAGAAAFYAGLLGWTTKPDSGLDTAVYAEWSNAGKPFGGLMAMRGDEWKGIPPHWMLYVSVADCDDRVAKATELGGSVRVPAMDIPNVGRFAILNDPQGATFALIQFRH